MCFDMFWPFWKFWDLRHANPCNSQLHLSYIVESQTLVTMFVFSISFVTFYVVTCINVIIFRSYSKCITKLSSSEYYGSPFLFFFFFVLEITTLFLLFNYHDNDNVFFTKQIWLHIFPAFHKDSNSSVGLIHSDDIIYLYTHSSE